MPAAAPTHGRGGTEETNEKRNARAGHDIVDDGNHGRGRAEKGKGRTQPQRRCFCLRPAATLR